jgi:hypothetical protein
MDRLGLILDFRLITGLLVLSKPSFSVVWMRYAFQSSVFCTSSERNTLACKASKMYIKGRKSRLPSHVAWASFHVRSPLLCFPCPVCLHAWFFVLFVFEAYSFVNDTGLHDVGRANSSGQPFARKLLQSL